MKKILLNKSSISLINEKAMYTLRKEMLPFYKALNNIPDKRVRSRVVDAINGVNPICDICKQNIRKPTFADAATQTCSNDPPETSKECINDQSLDTDATKKVNRRRRRKVKEPQVVKKSHAQQIQNHSMAQKRKSQVINDNLLLSPKKRHRANSASCNTSISTIYPEDLVEEIVNVFPTRTPREIMIAEFMKAERLINGLRPIHHAIIENNCKALELQIFVWKKMKLVDLNDLITEDDEDCLQLAIKENSVDAVEVLLRHEIDVNSHDAQSNNIIHLAILNDVDVRVLESLMKRIDINLLLDFNDDGFTVLHLALRRDSFVLAEVLINELDQRSFSKAFYIRENSKSRDDFLRYYEIECTQLVQTGKSDLKYSTSQQHVKNKLLNAGEICSGNSALFYATENKMEHFMYFLLAHLADPDFRNYSGQSVRSYFGEFSKMLNLSLKFDKIMEVVEQLLLS